MVSGKSSFIGFGFVVVGVSFFSPMAVNSLLDWVRDLLADFGTGEPSDICDAFLTLPDEGATSGVSLDSGD